jgi:hypothetical protein
LLHTGKDCLLDMYVRTGATHGQGDGIRGPRIKADDSLALTGLKLGEESSTAVSGTKLSNDHALKLSPETLQERQEQVMSEGPGRFKSIPRIPYRNHLCWLHEDGEGPFAMLLTQKYATKMGDCLIDELT